MGAWFLLWELFHRDTDSSERTSDEPVAVPGERGGKAISVR